MGYEGVVTRKEIWRENVFAAAQITSLCVVENFYKKGRVGGLLMIFQESIDEKRNVFERERGERGG